MNASSPAFEFSFASSGITGTGTFWAFPFASAGLYTAGAGGVGETGVVALEVGDAVVEPVAVGESLGVELPWQPLSNNAAVTNTAAIRA